MGLDRFLPGITEICLEIRDTHQHSTGNDDKSLVYRFHSVLSKLDNMIKNNQKIIILLDPEKECPEALIPFYGTYTV
ncbi:MAG: hypothetical protein NHB15_20710 [Methanosarcina barkeri]|nr:hypothetical protein [Methanosarcina sp. ERenArc_MAG2]